MVLKNTNCLKQLYASRELAHSHAAGTNPRPVYVVMAEARVFRPAFHARRGTHARARARVPGKDVGESVMFVFVGIVTFYTCVDSVDFDS